MSKQTAPRVTEADLENAIASEHYFTAWQGAQMAFWSDVDHDDAQAVANEPDSQGPLAKLTFCVLVLKNGLTVTGESVPLSLENLDTKFDQLTAREKALGKLWEHLAFVRKERLHVQAH